MWTEDEVWLNWALTFRADILLFNIIAQVLFLKRAFVLLGQGLWRAQDQVQWDTDKGQQQHQANSKYLHRDILTAPTNISIGPQHRRRLEQHQVGSKKHA